MYLLYFGHRFFVVPPLNDSGGDFAKDLRTKRKMTEIKPLKLNEKWSFQRTYPEMHNKKAMKKLS